MNSKSAHISAINKLETSFRLASLVSESNGEYLLDDEGFQFPAITAFSCLVKPQSGDQVLYASTDKGQNIILSIVSRQGDQHLSIEFPQNASLSSTSGSINFKAEQSISLSSAGLNMISDTMIQKADESYINVREMHANGEKLNANFGSIMVLSNFLSTMARQVVNKFMTYMRHSESFDQVKAGNMTRSVEGLYSMNSKQTVMLSKNDTKIDAERIHIG